MECLAFLVPAGQVKARVHQCAVQQCSRGCMLLLTQISFLNPNTTRYLMCLLHTLPLVQFVSSEKERHEILGVKSSTTLFSFTSTGIALEKSRAKPPETKTENMDNYFRTPEIMAICRPHLSWTFYAQTVGKSFISAPSKVWSQWGNQ